MIWRVVFLFFPLAAFVFLSSVPLNHDVAWLLEATRRWLDGEELYTDIVEINPPLIFFEIVLLTAGLLTKSAYLAGVGIAIVMSSFWVGRWHGFIGGLIVSAVLTAVGIIGFGQRDHLGLIFLLPFLMAPDRIGRREGLALAAWAFLGAGLKPYFLLIPGAYVLARCVRQRSILPALELKGLALGMLFAVWVLTVVLIWPIYINEITPLGLFVYDAFGRSLGASEIFTCCLIVAVALLASMRQPSLTPVAAASLGALAAFFIQQRFWPYHMIPAVGLAAISALLAAWRDARLMRWVLALAGCGLTSINLLSGPMRYGDPVIPRGIKSVLFLADAVPVAYPMVVECGVRNASRYPTFWTLPGAWNAMEDPARRERARRIFKQEVERGNLDIRKYRPAVIYEDTKPPKFRRPFRFADWFDLSNYRSVADGGRFIVWLRRDLPASTLDREICRYE